MSDTTVALDSGEGRTNVKGGSALRAVGTDTPSTSARSAAADRIRTTTTAVPKAFVPRIAAFRTKHTAQHGHEIVNVQSGLLGKGYELWLAQGSPNILEMLGERASEVVNVDTTSPKVYEWAAALVDTVRSSGSNRYPKSWVSGALVLLALDHAGEDPEPLQSPYLSYDPAGR